MFCEPPIGYTTHIQAVVKLGEHEKAFHVSLSNSITYAYAITSTLAVLIKIFGSPFSNTT